MGDFRPIYKLITKVLADRKGEIASELQQMYYILHWYFAFFPGSD